MSATWWYVFGAMVVVDVVYARYTLAVSRHDRWSAATWSVAIIATSGYVISSYTQDHTLLFPAALGAWVGTAMSVGTPDNKGLFARTKNKVLEKLMPKF